MENPESPELCSNCGTSLQDAQKVEVSEGATIAPAGAGISEDATIASTSAGDATLAAAGVDSNEDAALAATRVGSETKAMTAGWSLPAESPATASTLSEGFVLQERYQIVRLLGEGGMGSVYEANDLELDRKVAIKLIRPDLAADPKILKRFKRELIMARKVTHENVVRIYDLGSDQGLKFITMEFVEGRDLKSHIVDGPQLSAEESAQVIVQVCRALNSAHSNGIVHRDLKPQNVMIDCEGLAQVMDFGVAQSMDVTGMTRTGEMLGTPAYMSPEQAKGEPTDPRSDIFSLGIIFYELLTGTVPFEADTPYGMIIKRTLEKAPPPITLDPDIPEHMNRIVVRCLETEPELRYQNVREILQDLESRSGPRDHSVTQTLPLVLRKTSKSTLWAAAAAAVVLVGLGALWATGRLSFGGASTPAAGSAVVAPTADAMALAILPFRNASGDPSLDWLGTSLAEMLRSDVGQSAELRTISVDRISQILGDLKLDSGSTFDRATITQLGTFSNADKILVGQYVKVGDQIRIDARLHDVELGTETSLSATAPTESDLLTAVGDLAATVRDNLDLSSDAIRALEAASFTPSSQSIEALRFYSEGRQLARQGNYADARARFEAATDADPEFALAFSQLAQAHANLGFDSEAEQASRTANELADALPDFERYLISARHFSLLGQQDEAIDSYGRLLEAAPEDPELHFSLAGLYENIGALDEAYAELEAVLRHDPNYVEARYSIGRVEVRRGNAQVALTHFNQALGLSLDNDESRARILNGIGNTYRRLRQGEDALRTYREAMDINQRLDQRVGIAANLTNIGHVELGLGRLADALASYSESLDLRREIGDREGIGISLLDIGNAYLDMGRDEEAMQSYRDSLVIQREVGNELDEALCLNSIAAVYMERGNYGEALTHLEQALRIHEEYGIPDDLGLTLYNLGETSTNLGQFDEALDYYLGALEQWRQINDDLGVAWARVGTGTIFGYQGRFGAARDSLDEAVAALERSGEQGYWRFIVTAYHGLAAAQDGAVEEAVGDLGAALATARDMGNPALIAQALNFQGLNLLYRDRAEDARASFQEALEQANQAGDREQAFEARLHLDSIALDGGNAATVIDSLASTAADAETLGLRYLATRTRVRHAAALLATGDTATARRELQTALNVAERLQLRALEAECYYVLARIDEAEGDSAAATRRYSRAVSILDEIQAESDDGDPLRRQDLRRLYDAAAAGSR